MSYQSISPQSRPLFLRETNLSDPDFPGKSQVINVRAFYTKIYNVSDPLSTNTVSTKFTSPKKATKRKSRWR